MAGLALSTPGEFRGFLVNLKEDAQILDFLDVVGKDLVRSGVLREAEFSLKDPDRLQKAKLKARLIDSGVKIDDISTDAFFKDQPDDWWEVMYWELGCQSGCRVLASCLSAEDC